jgi:hypothetical protein
MPPHCHQHGAPGVSHGGHEGGLDAPRLDELDIAHLRPRIGSTNPPLVGFELLARPIRESVTGESLADSGEPDHEPDRARGLSHPERHADTIVLHYSANQDGHVRDAAANLNTPRLAHVDELRIDRQIARPVNRGGQNIIEANLWRFLNEQCDVASRRPCRRDNRRVLRA